MNITVTNHKGGCGKSTTAVHLAAYLAWECGEGSVVLVDTDPNGSALEWAARIAVACRCAQEVRIFQYDPAS